MQWVILTIVVLAAIVATYIHVTERRADRAVADKNADTERMKAENRAKQLDNEHYRDVTARAKMEFDRSRDPMCASVTLDEEHRRMYKARDAELEAAGISI